MGFSQSFPDMYFGGKTFSDAYMVSGSRNHWPNGVQIESLMSWMNDCAKYHRWDEEFGTEDHRYKVTPDGFEFYINEEKINPNINAENLADHKTEYSELRGRAWSYEEFWYQLYSQLSYMYEKTLKKQNHPLSVPEHPKFFFLSENSPNWEDFVSYLSGIESEISGVTYSGLRDQHNMGDPYARSVGKFLTPSGLSQYTKMKKEYYDPLINHEGFNGIQWSIYNIGKKYIYQHIHQGYLYDVYTVKNSQSKNGFEFYKVGTRTFSDDKEDFFNKIVDDPIPFSNDFSDIEHERISYFSLSFNYGEMAGYSNVIPEIMALSENDTQVGPFLYYRLNEYCQHHNSTYRNYYEIPYIQYMKDRYGSYFAYQPYIFNDKITLKVNATLTSYISVIDNAYVLSTYIGSGNLYNMYGIPTLNDSAEGFATIIRNQLDSDKENFTLDVVCGISKGFPTIDDVINGEKIGTFEIDNRNSDDDPQEIKFDLEKAFTKNGEGDKLYLFICFKDSRFNENQYDHERIRKEFYEFISSLPHDPFDPNNNWASSFEYNPESDLFFGRQLDIDYSDIHPEVDKSFFIPTTKVSDKRLSKHQVVSTPSVIPEIGMINYPLDNWSYSIPNPVHVFEGLITDPENIDDQIVNKFNVCKWLVYNDKDDDYEVSKESIKLLYPIPFIVRITDVGWFPMYTGGVNRKAVTALNGYEKFFSETQSTYANIKILDINEYLGENNLFFGYAFYEYIYNDEGDLINILREQYPTIRIPMARRFSMDNRNDIF